MKLTSFGLEIAKRQNDEARPKPTVVKILGTARDSGIRTGVLIAGRYANPGDLAELTEAEARDLIDRGRAELFSK